jgi:hypothetical protein
MKELYKELKYVILYMLERKLFCNPNWKILSTARYYATSRNKTCKIQFQEGG